MARGLLTHQVIFISSGQDNGVCSITISAMNTTDMRTVYSSFTHLKLNTILLLRIQITEKFVQLSNLLTKQHTVKKQSKLKPNLHSELPRRTYWNTRNRTKMIWRHNGTNLSPTNTCHTLEIKPHISNDDTHALYLSLSRQIQLKVQVIGEKIVY